MYMRTIWVCEHCGNKSEDKDQIYACEASHYGLTAEQMEEWSYLKDIVRRASYNVSVYKNERTDKTLDDAVTRLLKFEKKFHLEGEGTAHDV